MESNYNIKMLHTQLFYSGKFRTSDLLGTYKPFKCSTVRK